MTLVYDERVPLHGQPVLHALIAGVSVYPHLKGGGGPTSDGGKGYGMGQLASPALTAFRLVELLKQRAAKWARPLGTVRLLLSSSITEIAVEPKLKEVAPACTRAALAQAVLDWRGDVWSHKDNFALFYFGGHGVQKTKEDAIILTEDFGAPSTGGSLSRAASVGHIANLMAPGAGGPPSRNVGRTQFFFVDACRSPLPSLKKLAKGGEPPVIDDVQLADEDDRVWPVFSVLPGSKAYSDDGKPTLFGRALLECLGSCGGKAIDDDNGPKWVVTSFSLHQSIKEHLRLSNRIYKTEQECELGGRLADVLIHQLDGPPDADVLIKIDPDVAAEFARLKVLDPATRIPVLALGVPIKPHPYVARLKAGSYVLVVQIDPPRPPYVQPDDQLRSLAWPAASQPWRVKVQP